MVLTYLIIVFVILLVILLVIFLKKNTIAKKTTVADMNIKERKTNKHDHDVKIIVAGFERSGTASLAVALTKLNVGKVSHISTNTYDQNNAYLQWWIGKEKLVQNNEYIDYKEFFNKYKIDIAMDWPFSLYWKDILNDFPSAKVIVCVRDIDEWYISVNFLLDKLSGTIFHFMSCFDPIFNEIYSVWMPKFIELFGGKDTFKNKKRLQLKQNLLIQDMKNTMQIKGKLNNLLIYNPINDGWRPLCDFLDIKSIPSEPFPHSNSSKDFYKNTIIYNAKCKVLDYLHLRSKSEHNI